LVRTSIERSTSLWFCPKKNWNTIKTRAQKKQKVLIIPPGGTYVAGSITGATQSNILGAAM
jgi:hypothetical protein